MPTLDQIKKDKYLKMIKRLEKEKEVRILEEDEEEKLQFILKNIMTKDAFDYFIKKKEGDFPLYINMGMNIINTFNLVQPYVDLVIQDILDGKETIKLEKENLIRLMRELKGIRGQIKVVRDGKSKNLRDILKESDGGNETDSKRDEGKAAKNSRRTHKKGTSNANPRINDEAVG
jgi:hypothetical protein